MKIPPNYPEISVLLSSDIIKRKEMYYDSYGTGCRRMELIRKIMETDSVEVLDKMKQSSIGRLKRLKLRTRNLFLVSLLHWKR